MSITLKGTIGMSFKKVLVLGGNGMLGHVLLETLKKEPSIIAFATSRIDVRSEEYYDPLVDIHYLDKLMQLHRPDYVINCIGKLVSESNKNLKDAIYINSFLPHYIEDLCSRYACYFYHISTDCVFDGQMGPYEESSIPSSVDNYGRTKILGEVLNSENATTIRTSIIGPEVSNHKTGLFEWVRCSNEEKLNGYSNVFWSGVTTVQLAKFLKVLIIEDIRFVGLIHYGNGTSISKFDLLELINKEFKLTKTIIPVDWPRYNKHLLVRNKIAVQVPDYSNMIKEMSEWIIENGHLYDPKIF